MKEKYEMFSLQFDSVFFNIFVLLPFLTSFFSGLLPISSDTFPVNLYFGTQPRSQGLSSGETLGTRFFGTLIILQRET